MFCLLSGLFTRHHHYLLLDYSGPQCHQFYFSDITRWSVDAMLKGYIVAPRESAGAAAAKLPLPAIIPPEETDSS